MGGGLLMLRGRGMLLLRTLGALAVLDDSDCPVAVPPKPLALLAYLAAARPRGPHRRDSLLALFYPESDAHHGRMALRRLLLDVREAAGAEVLRALDREQLELNRAVIDCDAWRFEDALAGGDTARAVDAYGGPFLAGFHLNGSTGFEEWLSAERARLHRACAGAVERLAVAATERGDPDAGVEWWRRLVECEPHANRPTLALMKALAASGNLAGALTAAQEHARRRHRDLELAPAADVEAFAAELRGAIQAPPGPVPIAAPPASGPTAPAGAVWREEGRRRRRSLRAIGLAVASLLLATALGMSAWWRGTLIGGGALDRGGLLLLANFESRADDSSLAYAVEEALRAALADLRVARLVDPATASDGLTRMGRPRTTRLDEPVARELAEREHAQAYVTGEVSRLGTGYQISARIHSAADGRLLMMARVTARNGDEMITAVDRLAGRVRRGIGESMRQALARPELARVTTPSLAALRAYTDGVRRMRAGARGGALLFFREAVAIDSEFASAYWQIGGIHRDASRVSLAAEAIDRAYRFRDRLPERERLLVEATWYAQRHEFALAEAAFRRSAEPDEPLVFLSDLRLYQHRWSQADSLALRALDRDPENWSAAFNAIEARFAQGRVAAADSVVQRSALGPNFFGVWRLFARHDWGALRVYRDSMTPDAAMYLDTFLGKLRMAEAGTDLGIVRSDIPQALERAFYVLRYRRDTAATRRMVGEYLRRAGWDTLPPVERAYWYLIPLLAELGDVGRARRLLSEWEATMPDSPRLHGDRAWSLGAIALAEGRLDSAVAHFLAWHAAPYAGGQHWTNRGLAEGGLAMDRAGRPDTAMRLYERALAEPAFIQPEYEALWYPIVLRRLGELYDAQGDRGKAVEYYRQFVDLWKDADPELQPQVTLVRERMTPTIAKAPEAR